MFRLKLSIMLVGYCSDIVFNLITSLTLIKSGFLDKIMSSDFLLIFCAVFCVFSTYIDIALIFL